MTTLIQRLRAAAFVGLCLSLPVVAAEPESCPGLIASREALFSWANPALRAVVLGLQSEPARSRGDDGRARRLRRPRNRRLGYGPK